MFHVEVFYSSSWATYKQDGFSPNCGGTQSLLRSPRFMEKPTHKHVMDGCVRHKVCCLPHHTLCLTARPRKQFLDSLGPFPPSEGKCNIMRDASGLSEKCVLE